MSPLETMFHLLLASEGYVCITTIDRSIPQQRVRNKFFHDIPSAAKFALSAGARGETDVYFALGRYNNQRRTQANVSGLRSVWVDVDIKEYGHDHAKTLLAWRTASDSIFLPKTSYVVSTGGGYHLYWAFDRDLTPEEWLHIATGLKNSLVSAGLKFDFGVTTDSARILRVPGTLNWKYTPARHVLVRKSVLAESPELYRPQEFAKFVGVAPALPSQAPAGIPAALAGSVGADDLTGGMEKRSGGPYFAKNMAKACEIFKDAVATGGKDDSEPFWHAKLRVLAYCEDGEEYAHLIGNQHPDYSEADTKSRFDYKVSRKEDGGPTLCETLGTYDPDACGRCPFRSPNLKTPLVLGDKEDQNFPFGFKRDEEGVHRKDDKGEWKCFLPYELLEGEAVRDRESGELALRLVLKGRSGHRYEMLVPYSRLISDNRALAKVFGRYGITLPLAAYASFSVFSVAWLDQLARNRTVRVPHQNMGWVNKTEFAVGADLYDGKGELTGALHAVDPALVEIFSPKGTLESWRKAAQHVIDHGDISLSICLATAFAAPLVTFTSVQAIVFSFVSELSGQGKSTAMSLAQAVYGDPVLAMFTLDDTFASVIRKLGRTKNLPAYWDELQAAHAKDFVLSVIFRLSQGKEKSRLTSSSSLQESTSWETGMSVASNVSIMDQAVREGGGTNAGILRLLEFSVGPFSNQAGAQELLTNAAKDNYGHAGRVYAAHLAKHHTAIAKQVSETQAKLTGALSAPPDTRFWLAGITCLLVGARRAEACGLLKFPIKDMLSRLMQTYREQLAMMQKEVGALQTDEERCAQILHDYVSEFLDHGLVTETIQQTRGKPPPFADKVVGYPPKRMPLKWQRSENPAVLRVVKRDLRRYCLEHSLHAAKDMDLMVHLFQATDIKAALGTHTKYASVGRTSCLDFPLTHPALDGFDNADP